jgi:hypothetical protein
MNDIPNEVAQEARTFTRDFYFVTYGEGAQAAMVKAFEQYPGFAEGVAEGREVEFVLEDIMENAFQTFAWNNKVDPNELFEATQKLW